MAFWNKSSEVFWKHYMAMRGLNDKFGVMNNNEPDTQQQRFKTAKFHLSLIFLAKCHLPVLEFIIIVFI
jgi:hypothetical protein